METPASFYEPSRRMYPKKLWAVEYDSWMTVRRVMNSGCIKWKGAFIYVSQALAGEPVGLRQMTESTWEIWFSLYPLGIMDEMKGKVLPMSPV
jgi:hypothetical protein